jgi:hypothetical protein
MAFRKARTSFAKPSGAYESNLQTGTHKLKAEIESFESGFSKLLNSARFCPHQAATMMGE